MTKLVFDGAANAAKGAKLNSKGGRAAAEGQQAVDPLTGAALAAPAKGVPQKVGAAQGAGNKANQKVEAAKIVKQDEDAKEKKLQNQDEEVQPTSQGENLAMVDAASAASVGMMATETVAAQSEGDGGYDDDEGSGASTPLLIGALVLAGGGIAAAASGGGGGTTTPVNTAPTTTAQKASGAEDTSITGKLTATDTPGDTLTFALKSGTTAPAGFTLNSDGSFTLDAKNAAYQSLAQGETKDFTVNFTVKDAGGLSADSTLTITVTGVNDDPVITSNGGGATAALSVAENSTAVTTVTVSDPDAGATKAFTLSGKDAALFNIDANGVLTFKTAPDFENPADSGGDNVYDVTVTVSDGKASDSQALSVTVTNVNEAPVLGATQTVSTNEDTAVTVTATATDPEGGAVTYTTSGATNGTVVAGATPGTFVFTPSANFNGTGSFVVTAKDAQNNATSQTVTVNVAAVNDAPVNTVPGAQTVAEDTNLTVTGVSVADVDAGNSPLTVTISAAQGTLTLAGTTGLTFTTGDGTADATMTFSGTAAAINTALAGLVYRGNANYNGADTITITTSDGGATGAGGALTDTDTIAVTVTPVNDPPLAVADVAQVTEAGAAGPGVPTATGNVLDNDTDVDAGDTKTVTAVGISGGAAGTVGQVLTGTYGSVTINANGTYTYTLNNADPDTQALRQGDTALDVFTYTVSDSAGATSSSTLTVTVNGANDAAIITGTTTGAVTEDTNVVAGQLVATGDLNVTDVDAGEATFQAQTDVASANGYGTFSVDANGTWTYSADNSNAAIQALNTGQTLTDTFQVLSADGTAQTVTITINGVTDQTQVNIDVDNDGNTGTPRTFDASGGAFLFTENGATTNNVIITNFGADDAFQLTKSTNPGADPNYSFSNNGDDLIISYNGGGTANDIVIQDVLAPGAFVLSEADANAALNQALNTTNVDYFLIV